VALPADWEERVDRPETGAELERLRRCAARGAPLGPAAWERGAAARLGLGHTLRPRGRPPGQAAAVSGADQPPLFAALPAPQAEEV